MTDTGLPVFFGFRRDAIRLAEAEADAEAAPVAVGGPRCRAQVAAEPRIYGPEIHSPLHNEK